jgi:hypothetical protein
MSWQEKEYWIFCDESVQEGTNFSNFFGGAIVPAARHADVENRLRIAKAKIGFLKEMKWQRVPEQSLEGYCNILRDDGLSYGEPRHLLAQRRFAGGIRQPASPRNHCPGNNGRFAIRPRAVRDHR